MLIKPGASIIGCRAIEGGDWSEILEIHHVTWRLESASREIVARECEGELMGNPLLRLRSGQALSETETKSSLREKDWALSVCVKDREDNQMRATVRQSCGICSWSIGTVPSAKNRFCADQADPFSPNDGAKKRSGMTFKMPCGRWRTRSTPL